MRRDVPVVGIEPGGYRLICSELGAGTQKQGCKGDCRNDGLHGTGQSTENGVTITAFQTATVP